MCTIADELPAPIFCLIIPNIFVSETTEINKNTIKELETSKMEIQNQIEIHMKMNQRDLGIWKKKKKEP